MKYLKYINEALNEEDEKDIGDILLEVEDLGYDTEIQEDYILIGKGNPGCEELIFNEVKDCALRIKQYLGDNYIDFEFCYGESFNFKIVTTDLTEDTTCSDPLHAILIGFNNI